MIWEGHGRGDGLCPAGAKSSGKDQWEGRASPLKAQTLINSSSPWPGPGSQLWHGAMTEPAQGLEYPRDPPASWPLGWPEFTRVGLGEEPGEGPAPGPPSLTILDKPFPFSWARPPPRQNGAISHSCQPLAGAMEAKEGGFPEFPSPPAAQAGRTRGVCQGSWTWAGVLAGA